MSTVIELDVGVGRLRVVATEPYGISLKPFETGEARLAVLTTPDELMDDPLSSYIFETAVGPRGLLSSIRSDDERALALDLAVPIYVVTGWLSEGRAVTVACHPSVPVALVAAAVLVGSGVRFDVALDRVRAALPGSLMEPDEEITLSVALDHLRAYRDLNRRRDEAVQRGGDWWEVQ